MPHKIKEYVRQLNHKKSIRAVASAAIIMGLPVIGAYSYFLAVKNLTLDHIFFPFSHKFPKLKGLKIAQISDLHYGPTNKDPRFFNRAVDMILEQEPDLIFLTGDYYQWDPKYLGDLPKILARLSAPLGVYGVFGNHDYGACYPGTLYCDPFDHNNLKSHFGAHDIAMLTNEALEIDYNGQRLNLVGMHDLWSGFFDPQTAFAHADANLPTLVLSHNPDTVHLIEHDFDIMFSGHVHGGQFSLPLIGPIAVPVKNRHLRRGLHQITERKHLYVNRGLGYTFRMRWNSPPEVTLIEMV